MFRQGVENWALLKDPVLNLCLRWDSEQHRECQNVHLTSWGILGLFCQLAVYCLFWISKCLYCWCISQQHRKIIVFHYRNLSMRLYCNTIHIWFCGHFFNVMYMYLKCKVMWKCRKGRDITEVSWSVCLAWVIPVKPFSPVSQGPFCIGCFTVSPVTSQCLTRVSPCYHAAV